MLLILCPFCGPRNEDEFGYGGDATLPPPPEEPDGYARYLYIRQNPKGWHDEFWVHRYGCGAWLRLRRHTVTHEIASADLADAGPDAR